MKIGLLGPSDFDPALIRKASEFLFEQGRAEQVVYLGADDSAVRCARAWASELMGFPSSEAAFLAQAAELACHGHANELAGFLARERRARELSALRCLPEPPARAVEMFEGKVVLFVHDKGLLDAEDIANAFLIVYGRSKHAALNHFGPRTFFSPGPLQAGEVGLLERQPEGSLAISRFAFTAGALIAKAVLGTGHSKMVVQS